MKLTKEERKAIKKVDKIAKDKNALISFYPNENFEINDLEEENKRSRYFHVDNKIKK